MPISARKVGPADAGGHNSRLMLPRSILPARRLSADGRAGQIGLANCKADAATQRSDSCKADWQLMKPFVCGRRGLADWPGKLQG